MAPNTLVQPAAVTMAYVEPNLHGTLSTLEFCTG